MLLFFSALALVAVVALSVGAAALIGERSVAHARGTFESAKRQLAKGLDLRYQTFQAVSDLSYVIDVVRQVTQHRDLSDFGFATEEEDRAQLRLLHESLLDASWDWAGAGRSGFFAVADYKGRIVYADAAKGRYGADALGLEAIRRAYLAEAGHRGAMVVRGDDPRLTEVGLLESARPGLFVLFARATVLDEEPRAVFVQGVEVARFLEDVALADTSTGLALVAPDGSVTGSLPAAVLDAGLAMADGGAATQVRSGADRWLVQRSALPGLAGGPAIATLIVGTNLELGLSVLREGARLLWVLAAAVLAGALALAMTLANRLSRPVIELEGAAQRIRAGDLATRVPVRSRDEIGRLAQSFNAMAHGLAERERIERTFKKYVSPDVVEYLLDNPDAQHLGGERRCVTVLFTDLAGFTSLSESLSPEEVVTLLNEYLSLAAKSIVGRGGTLDKYLGDSVMAFFGAPRPRADHPASACRAALDQLAVLERLGPGWLARAKAPLGLRVGLNTGEVVVGNIGGEEGQEYTVIGDAVNLASRLEGANRFYGTRILAAESVVAATGGLFEFRELDLLRVKGKQQSVRLFELLADAGELTDTQEALRTRFAEGLSHYRSTEFTRAERAFLGALELAPDDGPSRVFLERSRLLAVSPPPDDWGGIFTLTDK